MQEAFCYDHVYILLIRMILFLLLWTNTTLSGLNQQLSQDQIEVIASKLDIENTLVQMERVLS